MTHIENIKKLFSRDFVENPLLETYEAGKIHITTGKIDKITEDNSREYKYFCGESSPK